jgi:hypothetical protein
MAEPYVPIARHTTAAALMTVLENAINTVDDDVEAIISDRDAAQAASISALGSEKQANFGLFLGGA